MAFSFNPNTIWVSHSSLSDFEKCPRLYYLRNIYRDKTHGNNFKIQVASPYLSLGEIVHDAIDNYIDRYTKNERNKDKLMYELSRGWLLKPGKIGGFKSSSQEQEFKDRSVAMAERFYKNKDFSQKSPIRSSQFPKKKLFSDKDIILVGNFDWLENFKDGLHLLDFKTGRLEEKEDSLQLPIYSILANENFEKFVRKTSYWYLDRDDEPKEVKMKDLEESLRTIKGRSIKIEDAIKKVNFSNKDYGCPYCKEYDIVVNNKAEHVTTAFKRKREIYFVP